MSSDESGSGSKSGSESGSGSDSDDKSDKGSEDAAPNMSNMREDAQALEEKNKIIFNILDEPIGFKIKYISREADYISSGVEGFLRSLPTQAAYNQIYNGQSTTINNNNNNNNGGSMGQYESHLTRGGNHNKNDYGHNFSAPNANSFQPQQTGYSQNNYSHGGNYQPMHTLSNAGPQGNSGLFSIGVMKSPYNYYGEYRHERELPFREQRQLQGKSNLGLQMMYNNEANEKSTGQFYNENQMNKHSMPSNSNKNQYQAQGDYHENANQNYYPEQNQNNIQRGNSKQINTQKAPGNNINNPNFNQNNFSNNHMFQKPDGNNGNNTSLNQYNNNPNPINYQNYNDHQNEQENYTGRSEKGINTNMDEEQYQNNERRVKPETRKLQESYVQQDSLEIEKMLDNQPQGRQEQINQKPVKSKNTSKINSKLIKNTFIDQDPHRGDGNHVSRYQINPQSQKIIERYYANINQQTTYNNDSPPQQVRNLYKNKSRNEFSRGVQPSFLNQNTINTDRIDQAMKILLKQN